MSYSEKIKLENEDFDKPKIINKDTHCDYNSFGYRHQQTLIIFLCLSTAYTMRTCTGVALVAMIDDSLKTDLNISTLSNNIFNDTSANFSEVLSLNDSFSEYNETIEGKVKSEIFEADGFLSVMLFTSPYPKFDWSKKIQDTMQSSFFWGYMVLQIPGGQLAQRFGTRRLLTTALAINCVASFIFPWLSYYGGWICAVICRLVQGLSQACVLPSIHCFFGKWAPLGERARLLGFALGGFAVGTVIGIPVAAFISASALGWPGIFRVYGVLAGLCAILVHFVIADSPALHRRITPEERRYIERGMGLSHRERKLPVPWKKIFRCRALYATTVAHIGQAWGQVMLFTEVPAFMDKVMGVNIKANGLLTALPFLVMWFTSFFFNWLTDMIMIKKYLNVTNTRKLANSIAFILSAVGLIVLAFVPKNLYAVESLLVFICAFDVAAYVGFMVNFVDMAPNFAGTTMSMSNFIANGVASLAPITAAFILSDDVGSESRWRIVFLIAAGIYLVTNLVYVNLGSAETASWNEPTKPAQLHRHESQPMITMLT